MLCYQSICRDTIMTQGTPSMSELSKGASLCCTFDTVGKAYQPIFTCRTCDPGGTSFICHYCIQRCHPDHEILDLYPKRDVVCDCGTTTVDRTILCQFSTKLVVNENNYTQNNKGQYCKCHTGYDGEEPMISCWVCQEWYHNRCLNIKEIPDGLFICCDSFINKLKPHNESIFEEIKSNYYIKEKNFCSCDECKTCCSLNNWEFVYNDDDILETEELDPLYDIDRSDVGNMMLKLKSFASHLKRSAYEAALEANDEVVDKRHVIKAIKKMKLTQDSLQMQELYDEVLNDLENEEDGEMEGKD